MKEEYITCIGQSQVENERGRAITGLPVAVAEIVILYIVVQSFTENLRVI